jgi:hypothetical protein
VPVEMPEIVRILHGSATALVTAAILIRRDATEHDRRTPIMLRMDFPSLGPDA